MIFNRQRLLHSARPLLQEATPIGSAAILVPDAYTWHQMDLKTILCQWEEAIWGVHRHFQTPKYQVILQQALRKPLDRFSSWANTCEKALLSAACSYRSVLHRQQWAIKLTAAEMKRQILFHAWGNWLRGTESRGTKLWYCYLARTTKRCQTHSPYPRELKNRDQTSDYLPFRGTNKDEVQFTH